MKPDPPATDTVQEEARRGSYDADDSDRPRWTADTSLEAEYRYLNQDGTYAFTVYKGRCADGRKTFLTGRQFSGGMGELDNARRADPEAFYKLPGLESVIKFAGKPPNLLYRADELAVLMAERPTAPVFLCEGEKDADTLRERGLIATTNPNGARKWSAEYSSVFEGRDVVALLDNDARGLERGPMIGKALLPVVKSLKLIRLPGLAQNGDVTDWLLAGNTTDELLKIVARTDKLTPSDVFDRKEDGSLLRSIDNARLALALLRAQVSYDEFASRYLVVGVDGFGPVLDDAALTRMRLLVEERWGLAFGKERWGDIVTDHARNNAFHPVRDMLDGLVWDRVNRLDGWLATYAGAEDTEYVRAVGAICLIAAVRRVRDPGCKFDEMLVIEGEQGGNKSSGLGLLAVREEWFADDLPLDADSKVLMERTAGRWIVELAELKGLRRGAVEHVKSMLSRRVDKARLAYGRMTTEQPRQCVFFGTTNDGQYLRDMTGNRRFWPVAVKRFDLAALRRDRDQLWAEAAARESSGESIRLPEELWAAAGEQQAGREIGDPFHDLLSERLDGFEGKVRSSDLWEAVGLGDVGRRTQDDNVRLSAAMQKLGWRRPKSKVRFDGRPQLAWVKGGDCDAVGAFDEVPRAVVLGLDAHGDDGRPM